MAKKWIIDLGRVRASDKGQEANTRSAIKAASKIRRAGAEGGMRRQKGGVVKEMRGVPDTLLGQAAKREEKTRISLCLTARSSCFQANRRLAYERIQRRDLVTFTLHQLKKEDLVCLSLPGGLGG